MSVVIVKRGGGHCDPPQKAGAWTSNEGKGKIVNRVNCKQANA